MRAFGCFVCALVILSMFTCAFSYAEEKENRGSIPIYIAFHWHMHQPIYQPYENVCDTMSTDSSIRDVFDQRVGPYTTWPADAVESGMNAGLEHLGAQVSFSGSLIENLNNIETCGECYGHFSNWESRYYQARHWKTSLGNPRLDFVGFGYHHPLMGLIDYNDTRKQIQAHKAIIQAMFGSDINFSKGFFPPENAFSERMIPALVDEGFEWVLVDNIHFERACKGYPWASGGNLYEPNPSEQVNANPNDWIQLTDVWAGTKISARWAHQPHYAQYVDNSGRVSKIIVVPASRYLGNEDGRGGFGALQYEKVLSQLEPYNTDPKHPILVVLAHDGDNYGGGSEGYYHGNFNAFIDWCKANPTRFVPTTVQDYLDLFPPDEDDIIHVEDGGWSGADNGDPEFKKWNGDPVNGYSPDRNSWAVVTAAKNWIFTADAQQPGNTNTQLGWKHLLNAETSCYWYWDGQSNWDSKPTMASNSAVTAVQTVVNKKNDAIPPTIFLPQREPYNPGYKEWGIEQPKTFKVWSFVYDLNEVSSVNLEYRIDGGPWQSISMNANDFPSQTNPLPIYKAKEYNATISCDALPQACIEYRVKAIDSKGNVAYSATQHVGGDSWFKPSPITFQDVYHTSVSSGSAVNIYASILSNVGNISKAELHYSVSGEAEQTIQMNFQGIWLGIIPASYITMGALISYYITAEDTEGNTARSQTYTFSVPHPIRIFNVTYSMPIIGSPLEIRANIETTAGSIVETQINYTASSNSYSYVQMAYSNGQYVGYIPGNEIKEGLVQFHIYASDSAGNRRESRTYSVAIGGAYYKPSLDGNNDFPESAKKYTNSGTSTTDIVGVWICNDDDFLYMGIELGSDLKANTTQDFVGVYFEDYSSPNATSVRYGNSLQTGVRLEVGWWDVNSFYCEHTYSGSTWAWVKNVNSISYNGANRFLELKIQRVEDTHAGWNNGRTIGLYVATAREAGSWFAGSVSSRLTYTFATNSSVVIEDPVHTNEQPVVTIISPENGTKCSGMVIVDGTAYDSDGYIRYVNLTFSSLKFTIENETNWSFIINVSSFKNGNYPLDVFVTDNEGANAFARIWLIVDNSLPPTVITPYCAINHPTNDQKLKGIIEIMGNATLFGTMRVYVKIENGAWNIANGTSSWRYVWNATAYPEGEYTIYAKASDGVIESKVAKVKVILSYTDKNTIQKEIDNQFSMEIILIAILVGLVCVLMVGLLLRHAKFKNKRNKKEKDNKNGNEK